VAATRAALEARGRIVRAVRAWFEGQGFLEVETPARVRSPGQELHLDAIPAGDGHWLITSPEYHLKKLIAGGLPRIFEIARCWRAEESGAHHRSEFTMLEWYRADAPLEALAADCEALVAVAVRAAGRDPAALGLAAPFGRTTVRELFARQVGIVLAGDETPTALRETVAAAGVAVGTATAWDDIFYQAFLDRIEPALAAAGPTFVFDWPAPLGALARPHPFDPRVVERFELYAGGLELANAFGELTDPVEQRRRFMEEARLRAARGKQIYPLDEALLEALPRMPPTAGIALGLDRLVMLALGAGDISEVLSFDGV
jgi:elongation factor P--(R)-beta-lysine ligase